MTLTQWRSVIHLEAAVRFAVSLFGEKFIILLKLCLANPTYFIKRRYHKWQKQTSKLFLACIVLKILCQQSLSHFFLIGSGTLQFFTLDSTAQSGLTHYPTCDFGELVIASVRLRYTREMMQPAVFAFLTCNYKQHISNMILECGYFSSMV